MSLFHSPFLPAVYVHDCGSNKSVVPLVECVPRHLSHCEHPSLSVVWPQCLNGQEEFFFFLIKM